MSIEDDIRRARELLDRKRYEPDPYAHMQALALNSAERTGRVKALREAANWLAGMAEVSCNFDTELVERAYLHASDEFHKWADEAQDPT